MELGICLWKLTYWVYANFYWVLVKIIWVTELFSYIFYVTSTNLIGYSIILCFLIPLVWKNNWIFQKDNWVNTLKSSLSVSLLILTKHCPYKSLLLKFWPTFTPQICHIMLYTSKSQSSKKTFFMNKPLKMDKQRFSSDKPEKNQ